MNRRDFDRLEMAHEARLLRAHLDDEVEFDDDERDRREAQAEDAAELRAEDVRERRRGL